MKIRSGYVSNSSSSSFIVSYNEDAKFKAGEFEFGVQEFFDLIGSLYESHSDSTKIEHNSKEGIVHEVNEWYSDNKDLLNLIETCKEDNIVQFQICYDDEFIKKMFDLLVKTGKINVIYGEK